MSRSLGERVRSSEWSPGAQRRELSKDSCTVKGDMGCTEDPAELGGYELGVAQPI